MSVVVIGVNNRTMPLDLFEQVAVAPDHLCKALADVHGRHHVSEAVVLSTCNRTEVFVYAEKFHGAYQEVRDFLAEGAGLAPEIVSDHLYVHYDNEAIRHLFAVTCGIDSAVIGENEIQRQVKTAWESAQQEGACGATLNTLFRHALEVGKRARTETGISRHTTSVSQAAVAMASAQLGGLDGSQVLVLGAGDMGEGMATTLAASDLAALTFANRSAERAERLAARVGGRAVALDELSAELDRADVLLTSTGASALMVDRSELAEVMDRRAGRPLLIVDIAVPRDVDPSAADLDGVTLLDMDDLRAFAEAGRRDREVEAVKARQLIDDEVDRFLDRETARQVAPLVADFRRNAETIRTAELERFSARLATLDDEQRQAVEALTAGLLGKLLHPPTIRLNEAAGSPRGDRLADALRELYDL